MAYKAPVRDLTFILNEVLEIDRYSNQAGFEDISSDLVGQILEGGLGPRLGLGGSLAALAVVEGYIIEDVKCLIDPALFDVIPPRIFIS